MSFVSKHFEFMQPVLTAQDLELPAIVPGEVDGQIFDLKPGDRVLLFSEGRQQYSETRFKEWLQLTQNSKKVAIFSRLESGEQIPLSNAGMRKLEKAGRIVPVGSDGRRRLPGSALALPEADRLEAERAMAYVDEYYPFFERVRSTRGPSKKITREFIAEVAAKRGEDPPSYEWLRKMVGRDRGGTRFDRLMNFARVKRRGNETLRLPPLIHEALEIAAHFAWSQPQGDYKTMQNHFVELVLTDPRFEPVRHRGVDSDGVLKIGKSSFDEKLGSVDFYTRDLLRFGPETAAAKNQQYIRIARPQCLMDIVDVDHLKTDIVAYLDANPLACGRLDLLVFRERMTGTLIAVLPSFGDPSYTTFLRGLELAIFGLEDRLLAGVSWPWFGLFNRLGVDNALHFIGDSISAAAKALGFDIVEYRPARPGDKGALERALGTITRDVFHALPGTTLESPKIRELFGEDRDMAVPLLALSEVEAVLQHWIANIYHQTPRAGLGGDLLTFEGVPAELWAKHEASIPRRPLLDRSIFARLAGEHRRVTIQKDGIRTDGIHYNAPGLLALSLHPKTKRAKAGHATTRFDLTINVNNIGQAWVTDPYRGEVIEVQAVGPDLEYCTDMSMDVHKTVLAYRRSEAKKKREVPTLLEARRKMHQILLDLIGENRKKLDPRRKLAKFVQGHAVADRRRKTLELARREADGIINMSTAAAVHTNVYTVPINITENAAPSATVVVEPETPKTRKRKKAGDTHQMAPRQKVTPPLAPNDDDDIDDLLARNPEWKK
ncbi:Integrase family protein [Neorhizobium galegae bv. officinalis]|uniref:Integrase family protein n=1 Tax=Neorhizobium galegae bv. officinalis TaxID=323656 RepID=A0A0T7FA50_NEOGA|nr:hypothetical protein [Neorhizobium galegae]CDZ31918.1 Integrase family protein [Neorhizobium galegae bv. officinalis]